jgi:hypothetical protein
MTYHEKQTSDSHNASAADESHVENRVVFAEG